MRKHEQQSAARPLLIDTDAGVDDALALCLALRSPEVRVVAITTVHGNVSVQQAAANVGRILDLLRPEPRPPVSLGAERPLLQSPTEATEVHGRDGLGGATYRRDAEGNLLYPEPSVPLDPRPATELILQAAAAHPGELTIAALGPLTNLALAARTDPERIRLIREILWMGGAFRRFGNCSPVAEFNAYADPHAAAIVLEAGVPLRIFPLDVTERIVLKPELVARYRQTPLGRFVDHITGHLFAFSRRVEGVEGMYVHDAATIAYLVEPERFRFLERWVVVETEGRWTRGQTIADLRRPPRFDGKRNALLALDVEGEAPVRLLEERVLKGTGA